MNRRERAAKAKHYARIYGIPFRHPFVRFARTRRWKFFLTSLTEWRRQGNE